MANLTTIQIPLPKASYMVKPNVNEVEKYSFNSLMENEYLWKVMQTIIITLKE